MTSQPLTDEEQATLRHCELLILQRPDDYLAVGKLLKQIRDRRLFRGTHSKFSSYCRVRFGRRPRWVKQTIDAADVVQQMGLELSATQPTRQQALVLAKLPENQRSEAWNSGALHPVQAAEKVGRPMAARTLQCGQVQFKRLARTLSRLGMADELTPQLSAIAKKLRTRWRHRDRRASRRRAHLERPRSIPTRQCQCTGCGAKSKHRVGELARAAGVRCPACGGNVVEERFV